MRTSKQDDKMEKKQPANKYPSLIHKLIYIISLYIFKFIQVCRFNFPKPDSIYFHCTRNYGDHIQNMAYLNSLARDNIDKTINYAVQNSHLNQIKEFSFFDNLKVIPIHNSPFNSIDLWKNSYLYWSKSSIKEFYYDFYIIFFGYISDRINMRNPIKSKRDLLIDIGYSPKKFDDFDILIVNSKPLSNQFTFSKQEFNIIIENLSNDHKVITTEKVSDIKSTTDLNLSLREIGELSLYCKVIITISTGPSWPILNKHNFDSNKPILILHNGFEKLDYNSNSICTSSLSQIIPFIKKVL